MALLYSNYTHYLLWLYLLGANSSFVRGGANSGGGGGGRGGRMLSVLRRLSSRQSPGSSSHGGDNCVPLGSLSNGLLTMGLPHGPALRRSNSAPILRRGEHQDGGEQLLGSERPSNLRGHSTAGAARSPPPPSRKELSISRTELTISRRGSKSSNHSNSGGEGARVGSPLAARCSTMGNPSPFLLRRGSKSPSNPRSPPLSRRGSREPSQSPKELSNNQRTSPPGRPPPLPLGMAPLPPLSTAPLQGLVSLSTQPDSGALARVARRPSGCQFVVSEGAATTGDGGAG